MATLSCSVSRLWNLPKPNDGDKALSGTRIQLSLGPHRSIVASRVCFVVLVVRFGVLFFVRLSVLLMLVRCLRNKLCLSLLAFLVCSTALFPSNKLLLSVLLWRWGNKARHYMGKQSLGRCGCYILSEYDAPPSLPLPQNSKVLKPPNHLKFCQPASFRTRSQLVSNDKNISQASCIWQLTSFSRCLCLRVLQHSRIQIRRVRNLSISMRSPLWSSRP